MLAGKHIILGVSGGIAAYKSALLVRELVKAGAEVQVVMTPAATRFITPLTLGTLSQRDVIVEMLPASAETPVREWTAHISLALWADLMVVAPATANTIAHAAHGLAETFLDAVMLALRCPLAIAPSMDMDMYRHPATQENLRILRDRGVRVLEPESGALASGLNGPGRLPDSATLLAWIDMLLTPEPRDLAGKHVVITAGPTHEPLDPVRYLGNYSSGKMGFALAAAAAARGARVTLISGPVALPTPPEVVRVDVTTAAQMLDAARAAFASADALIMAAAVADFTPAAPADEKIKREAVQGGSMNIALKPNPDIVKILGSEKKRQVLVGFALETADGEANARKKLAAKNLDMIVLNNLRDEGAGFGGDTNVVTLMTAEGAVTPLPKLPKTAVAGRILDFLLPLLR